VVAREAGTFRWRAERLPAGDELEPGGECSVLTLDLEPREEPLAILCLGAHADDVELGCGGTILKLGESGRPLAVTWVVFSAEGKRQQEARESAELFLARAKTKDVVVKSFRDGFFPYQGREIKEEFEALKQTVTPDLVFTHYRNDLHQDHRLISELTWNTFRSHFILEYEIPKYDGDLGSPNVFVELSESVARRKVEGIVTRFRTQTGKHWFSEEVFMALLCLRGMECIATERYAEGFYGRKAVLSLETKI
jgi:LmbE family N-acetylglucosaminyl deacetylase